MLDMGRTPVSKSSLSSCFWNFHSKICHCGHVPGHVSFGTCNLCSRDTGLVLTSCTLYKKVDTSFNYTINWTTLSALPMSIWEKRTETHHMFVFWNLTLYLELILLEFLKSIKKGEFKLYTHTQKSYSLNLHSRPL